jgi:hypothetical protein
MPVEIKSVKTKRGTVELGKNFPEEDDWFDGLTVSIKNTSGKTIIYLGGGFLFPRPEDEPSQQAAPPRYQRFMYGRHPLLSDDALQTIEPINVKPGEIFSVTISGEEYGAIRQRLKELGYSASVKEINFNVEEIYFDDGTGWSVGSWYERDPNDKKKYRRIEKPPDGSRLRRQERREQEVPFFKIGFAMPDGGCWVNDGFLSVSCTTTSPSNCWRRKAIVRSATGTADVAETKLLSVDDECRTQFGLGPVVCAHRTNQIHVTCEIGDCVQYFPCTPPAKWNTLECRCMTDTTSGGGGCYSKQEYCFANPDAEVCSDPQAGMMICMPSPVVVDVAGDGVSLTDTAHGVNFDLDAGGNIAERVAWTAADSDDAWLALDRNGNGRIDSGAELFGNVTAQPPSSEPNGFLALAEFDKAANGGNGDGVIDSGDAVFDSLRLWQDANHNGVSEAGELHGLLLLKVARLELDFKESKRTDQYGNQFRYRAKVRDERVAQVGRWAWDVFLLSGL